LSGLFCALKLGCLGLRLLLVLSSRLPLCSALVLLLPLLFLMLGEDAVGTEGLGADFCPLTVAASSSLLFIALDE